MKPEMLDTVRERERERELHFSNKSAVLLGRNTFICDIDGRLFILKE